MAEGVRFSVSLEDHVSPGAKAASKGLKELQNELAGSKSKLALYQQQLSHSKQLGDVEGYRKYSKLVEEARRETFELGNALTKAGGPVRELGEHFFKVKDPVEIAHNAIEGFSSGLKGLASSLRQGDIEGAVEGATEALAGMAQTLDLLVPGLGQAAAAVIKVAGAMTGALAGITEEAVKTALEVNDVNERLTATFEALGEGPDAGKKTLAMLDELSSKLPQTRDQLAKWATQFEALGYTDLGALRGQIRAVAAAQAIGGDTAVSAYTMMIERVRVAVDAHQKLKLELRSLAELRRTGVGLGDIASRMGMSVSALSAGLKAGTIDAQKFGDALSSAVAAKGVKPLDAMSDSLESLKAKGLEVFEHLFDGIDTSPITDAIKSFIHLGDQGTASGKALHAGMKEAIQGVITWIGKMMTEGEVMFLTLELYALKHKKELKLIEKAFVGIGDAILGVTHALEFLFQHEPPPWLARLTAAGATFGLSEVAIGATKYATSKAHADGGVVHKPAAGEYFASVAPGEMILPRRQTRELLGGGLGPGGRAMVAPANTNGAGGAAAVHIDHLVVQAPEGVTDATQLSATGISIALERLQLASGR